jgi:hypothetical protein
MHENMNQFLADSGRQLDALEKLLAAGEEKLWLSAQFGSQAAEFQQRLEKAFATVLLSRERATELVTINVEDWAYAPPARERPRGQVSLVCDLIRSLLDAGHPEEDYWRTVRRESRREQFTVWDDREPGAGPCNVEVRVQLHEVQPPQRKLPAGDYVLLLWRHPEVPLLISRGWVHKIVQAWRRLRGREIPDREFEPQLVNEPREQLFKATLAAIPLESLSPVERAYWAFRQQLRKDVNDITHYITEWNAVVCEQAAQTAALVGGTEALAKAVEALPCTDQIAGQLQQIQRRMAAEEASALAMENDIQRLFASIQIVKRSAKELRPELPL